MLHSNTIQEIKNNVNTGIEYEIALFYALSNDADEKHTITTALSERSDVAKINRIISQTNIQPIIQELNCQGLTYTDCSFETQNDDVGPADIVLYLSNGKKLGISVKYANTCNLNVTGMKFITLSQKAELQKKLVKYTDMYVKEMKQLYGDANNWFRKRKPSVTTDAFIDLIRDAVIANWDNISDKTKLLQNLYHADSPINYWVVEYNTNGAIKLNTNPIKISPKQATNVKIKKYQTSFIAFYLNGVRIGHMQVKFNNGFVERCKKSVPDISVDGIEMTYGKPFSSWNFSIERYSDIRETFK